jgi:NAD-dependent dihydropyrimidine dehydrogenase PreA subunit
VAYVITETCIGTQDKSCVDVCPVDCIHFEEGTDRMLYINPDECIDCGACEPACPVKAIYPEDAVPENMEPWIKINAIWYDNPGDARAAVDKLVPA